MGLISSLNRSEEAAMPSCPLAFDHNCVSRNRHATDTGDKGSRLGSLRAEANRVGFSGNARVTDIDIVIAYSEIASGVNAHGDVRATGGVAKKRTSPLAVLLLPVVLPKSAFTPSAVFLVTGACCDQRALRPSAVLKLPVVLLRAH